MLLTKFKNKALRDNSQVSSFGAGIKQGSNGPLAKHFYHVVLLDKKKKDFFKFGNLCKYLS